MALTSAQALAQLKWDWTEAISDWSDPTLSDSLSSIVAVDTDTYDEILRVKVTLAGAATTTIDLQSFIDAKAVSGASLASALTLLVVTGDSSLRIEPDASNGLTWFWTASGSDTPRIEIPANGWISFGSSGSPVTVDGTHKVLKLTDTGSGGTSYIAIVGAAS